jgi:uncharacterized protein
MDILVQNILETFKALLICRVSIHKLILYGSRARGDADSYSDLDIIVIVENDVDDELSDYISECAWQAGFKQGVVVVPIVYSKDEWKNGPERNSVFVRTIVKEGLLV